MKTNHTDTKTKWSIDQAHSEISFKVRHLMISHVKGTFKTFDASIYTIGKDFRTTEVDLWIDASSINTGDTKRDEHLKSPDFFDVENYPKITFEGSGLKDLGDDMYELKGSLTIKGVSRPVTLAVEHGGIMSDPWGNVKAGFSITGKINRKDWGLNWNAALEAGGVLVGEEVKISCDIELLKAAS